jgi:hypothetical protein
MMDRHSANRSSKHGGFCFDGVGTWSIFGAVGVLREVVECCCLRAADNVGAES